MRLNIIVATCKKNGIGKDNCIPWFIKGDLRHFKNITCQVPEDEHYNYVNMVIMGRNTWESIPENRKPLPGRINVVLTSKELNINPKYNSHIIKTADSLDKAILLVSKFNMFCSRNPENNFTLDRLNANTKNISDLTDTQSSQKINRIYKIFIIGGQRPYEETIIHSCCDRIYMTEVYKKFDCDTFFPSIKDSSPNVFSLVNCSPFHEENNLHYRFLEYQNVNYIHSSNEVYRNKEDLGYLNLMSEILNKGIERGDRTGTGTLSLFGTQQKFDLRHTFPMTTTKRVFLRGIFEELMMYLRGQTDNKILIKKNIHIWDGNTSREFLDKRGLGHYEVGDLGETYGFNFRHFGAEYKGCGHKYGPNDGFDQLAYAIDLIKNNPESRRIMINLWNPATLKNAALPSCLCQYQFYVDTIRKELHLQIYLRSSDFFLANNWNTCTGALLVHMLCNLNGIDLTPGELTVVTGDTHLYKNHIKQVKINIGRQPYPYPKLVIKERKDNIEDFEWSDIIVYGYKAHPRIPAEMAI